MRAFLRVRVCVYARACVRAKRTNERASEHAFDRSHVYTCVSPLIPRNLLRN